MNYEGVMVSVVPLRGTVVRAATAHTGRIIAVAPSRGTVARAATTHTGRTVAVVPSRGTVARASTAHTGVVRSIPVVSGVRNKMLMLMDWGDDGANKLAVRYSYRSGAWEMARYATREDIAQFPAPPPVSGSDVFVMTRWEAGLLGVSIGGSPFVTIPSTHIPIVATTIMNIGANLSGGSSPGVNYDWMVLGAGPVGDADAAALNALGNADVTIPEMPNGWQLIWNGGPTYTAMGTVGAQALKAIIYDSTDTILGESDEVIIDANQSPSWVDFAFTASSGRLVIPMGRIGIGIHGGGPVTNVARMYGDDPRSMGGKMNNDTYVDGASTPFGAATTLTADLSIFLTAVKAYGALAPSETDLYYSRLPWNQAQDQLAVGGAIPGIGQVLDVGWHDTFIDPEIGANALVAANGPYAHLVGERLKITTQGVAVPRVVYVYVHNTFDTDLITWDLSVTRRAFSQLGMLASDTLNCVVEIIA